MGTRLKEDQELTIANLSILKQNKARAVILEALEKDRAAYIEGPIWVTTKFPLLSRIT
jgi:hypothetical protein